MIVGVLPPVTSTTYRSAHQSSPTVRLTLAVVRLRCFTDDIAPGVGTSTQQLLQTRLCNMYVQ